MTIACLLLAAMPAAAAATEQGLPAKVRHAEPLFIDLIRDLGAHRGEREWNIGFGLSDQTRFDRYEALVEYEWAPVHRLGLEVEVPMTFYPGTATGPAPSNRIEGLKSAVQWTLAVRRRSRTSFALGYINTLRLPHRHELSAARPLQGLQHNPFLVGARQLSANWHSLLLAGPRLSQSFHGERRPPAFDLNASVHYMLESRNFVGVEVNKTWQSGDADLTLRPQMRLAINDRFLVGILTGIPVQRDRERLSTFVRLIYEPRHR